MVEVMAVSIILVSCKFSVCHFVPKVSDISSILINVLMLVLCLNCVIKILF